MGGDLKTLGSHYKDDILSKTKKNIDIKCSMKIYDIIDDKVTVLNHLIRHNIIYNYMSKITNIYNNLYTQRNIDDIKNEDIKNENYTNFTNTKETLTSDFIIFFNDIINKEYSNVFDTEEKKTSLLNELKTDIMYIIENIKSPEILYKIGSKAKAMRVLVNENNDVIKQTMNIDNKSCYHEIKNVLNGSNIDEANKYIIEKQNIYEQIADLFPHFISPMWSVTKLMVFYKNDKLIGHIFINDLWHKSTSTLTYGGIQVSYKQLHNPQRIGLAYIMLYYVSSYAKTINFDNIRVMLSPIGHMRTVFCNIIKSVTGKQAENILPEDINTDKITLVKSETRNCKFMKKFRVGDPIHYECLNLNTEATIKYSSIKLESRNITAQPISI
jgi:hypothetical protein